MTSLARLSDVARRVTGRGGHVDVPSHLALNLSFVLHEASGSAAVRRTAEAAALHIVRSARVRALDSSDIVIDGFLFVPDEWLSVRVGYPDLLVDALALIGIDPRPVTTIDGGGVTTPHRFFRAPASLALQSDRVHPPTLCHPDEEGISSSPRGDAADVDGRDLSYRRDDREGAEGEGRGRTVGVVALVARPGGIGAQLVVRSSYNISDGMNPAVRQVEALVQSYADQWMPERALWSAPAEVLLGDEVR